MEINVCPSCNCQEYSLIGQLGTAINVVIDNDIFCQPDYRVRSCLNCGLYYKSSFMDEQSLLKYYLKIDPLKWESHNLYPTEKKIIELILKLDIGSKILDFGCSTGRLLSPLTSRYKCFGVELNESASQVANNKGINIITEEELISFNQESGFDVIVMCDVFEHLIHPTDVLRYLFNSLKSGGLLIICTGNGDAKFCKKDIANFWYLRNIEHITMFSYRYAQFLEKDLKCKLLSYDTLSHYELTLYEKISQYIKTIVYWQFKEGKNLILRSLLKMIPLIRNAENWSIPPYFVASRDHVIAVFQKTLITD